MSFERDLSVCFFNYSQILYSEVSAWLLSLALLPRIILMSEKTKKHIRKRWHRRRQYTKYEKSQKAKEKSAMSETSNSSNNNNQPKKKKIQNENKFSLAHTRISRPYSFPIIHLPIECGRRFKTFEHSFTHSLIHCLASFISSFVLFLALFLYSCVLCVG